MSSVFNRIKDNIVPLAIIFAVGYATGGVGFLAGAKLGFATATAAALYTGGLAVGLAVLNLALADDPPGNQGIDYGSATTTIRAEVIPAQWAVGRVRKAGLVNYLAVDEDTIHMAVCLSEGSCDGIERVFVREKDEFLFERDATDRRKLVPTGTAEDNPYKYTINVREARTGTRQGRDGETETYTFYVDVPHERNALEIYEYFAGDGSEGQELRDAVKDIPGSLPWNEQHTMEGKSWIYIKATQPPYDNTADDVLEQRFWRTLPDISVLMKGIKITWPGQTTPIWTENTAAIYYWWLTERRGLSENIVNLASFNSAYALCNQSLSLTGARGFNPEYPATIPRYTTGGTITSNSDVANTEEQLNFCMIGRISSFGGQIYLQPGADSLPVAVITDDMVIAEPTITLNTNENDRFNSLVCSLEQSDLHNYGQHSTNYLDDQQSITRDGDDRVVRTINSNLLNKPTAALNNMAVMLRDRRAALTIDLTLMSGNNFELMSIRPGEKVLLQVPEVAAINAPFRLVSSILQADNSVRVVLREFPDDLYEDTIILPDLSERNIPIPLEPSSPVGINANITPIINRQGNAVFELDVSWQPTTTDTIIYVSRVGGGFDSTRFRTGGNSYKLELNDTGTYNIELRHIDAFGRSSGLAMTSATVLDSSIPVPTPVLESSSVRRGYLRSVYSGIGNRDVRGIEIRARFQAGAGTQPNLPPLTADNWDEGLNVRTETILPSVQGGDIESFAYFQDPGWYRLYARFVNHFDVLSPLVDLGYHIISLPEVAADSFHAHPQWEGISSNMYRWVWDSNNFLLSDQPNARTMTAAQWRGTTDKPFGDSPTGYFECASKDLGQVRDVNITVESDIDTIDGRSFGNVSYIISHRQSESDPWNDVNYNPGTPVRANARFIKSRITANTTGSNIRLRDFILTAERV